MFWQPQNGSPLMLLPFEAGSYTPTVSYATPGDSSFVYTTQIGSYYKIGDLVVLTFQVAGTPTFTTASGALRLTLPFTVNPLVSANWIGSLVLNKTTAWPAGGYTQVFSRAITNTQLCDFLIFGPGLAQGSLNAATYFVSGTAFDIRGSISYRAA